MQSIQTIKLSLGSTIKDAMQVINDGAMKIAVVLDGNDKLLGVITDGDVRRALLNELSFDTPIDFIIQKNPFVCYINDSKEEILAKTLGKKIYHIPVLDENEKVVGIEDINSLIGIKKKNNKIVLMVGGLGSRLRPLTHEIPKPMLKVGNKPILETIINNFRVYGFTDIILSVNYKADIVKKYFGDGSKFGVNIEYIHEEKRMGTAGALSLMHGKFQEPFFVMNGDLLTNVNFEHFLNFHYDNNAVATMAVREYEHQVPYGVINQENGQILSIVEKPKQHYYVNAGIYILNPNILDMIPKDLFYDMPTLFDALIQKEKKPISFPIHEYWLDIGQINELQKARDEYFNVFPN